MRAGPLSDQRVINLLNSSFVPVYAPNEDYTRREGKAPPAEKAERARIYGTFIQRKMGAGDVHIYIVTGDGQPVEGLEVAKATQPGNLYNFLSRISQTLQVKPGAAAIQPQPLSAPPQSAPDSMVFHLVARGASHGSWREFPGENWMVLGPSEWALLLPSAPPKVGDTWEVPDKMAARLLTNFYPQTEDVSDDDRNQIEEASIRMKAVSATPETIRVRIEGTLKMRRRFAPHKGEYQPLSAAVLGFMDISTGNPRIRRFNLTTWQASYGSEEFGVALRYLPAEGLEMYRR